MKHKKLLLSAAGAAALTAAFWHGLTERHYEISTSKLEAGESVRIVHLSDLHSCRYGENQETLIRRIRHSNPDLIVMTGDMFDDRRPSYPAMCTARRAARLAPCFYVTGNHEYRNPDYEVPRLKNDLLRAGVLPLAGDCQICSVRGHRLAVCGTDDFEGVGMRAARRQIAACAAQVASYGDPDLISLMLIHRPTPPALFLPYGFDLAFSGHAHGGQIRIPGLMNGLAAPNQYFFPPYAGGLYNHSQTTHIVSRGLSRFLRMPRFFDPPELVIVDLKGS